MTFALWRHCGALLSATLLAGCATIPRDSGFADVQQAVKDQTGQSIEWDPRRPIDRATSDDAVRPLLQDTLTTDRAVQIALANNRDLQATLEELGIARAEYIAAATIRNPILDAEIRFPGSPKNPFEIALSQTLMDILQLRMRRQLGAALFQAARLRVTGAILNFAAEVRIDYFDLLAAQQILARQRLIGEAARLSAELAKRQHTAGNISDLDLENEQALYEQAKLDLARTELSALQTRERLIMDLGLLEASNELKLPDAFERLPDSEPPLQDDEMTALSRRLDVLLARQELEAAQRQLPLARTAVLDELAVGVHREREPEGKKTTGPAVAVPIPIFNRGAAQRTRAIAMLRQAQQRYAALEVNARSEVRAARERIVEARARAEYLRDVVVPRRQRILLLTQLEYNAMQRGVFQLIQAKQNEANAQRESVLAQRDYWVGRAELDAATSGVSGFNVRDEGRIAPRPNLFRPLNQQDAKENH